MKTFGTIARRYLELWLRRAVRPLLVSAVYIALFISLERLMPGLKFLPEVSRWNLPAGLSFGLLLGYGLLYAPVVFTAHALAAFRPDTMAITQR